MRASLEHQRKQTRYRRQRSDRHRAKPLATRGGGRSEYIDTLRAACLQEEYKEDGIIRRLSPAPNGAPRFVGWEAHVLGRGGVSAHSRAVSTSDDIEVGTRLGPEWGAELVADHYAAKWGFGRLIASRRSGRCVEHHGPVPGEDVVVAFGEHHAALRITRDRVPVCEGLVR